MIKSLFQDVLVVVNGAETSIHAVQYGIIMARLYECSLKAVYVVDTATLKQLTLSKFFVADESSEYESNLRLTGARYLEYVQNLGKAKNVHIETELRCGSVWSEVITAAEEIHAGLILLGSCRHDGVDSSSVKYDAVSSANTSIIKNARCSVLLVREENVEKLYKLL